MNEELNEDVELKKDFRNRKAEKYLFYTSKREKSKKEMARIHNLIAKQKNNKKGNNKEIEELENKIEELKHASWFRVNHRHACTKVSCVLNIRKKMDNPIKRKRNYQINEQNFSIYNFHFAKNKFLKNCWIII